MSSDKGLLGSGEAFSEALETKIVAGEGFFKEQHSFLITALRGLALRLYPEVAPIGFATATELYLNDINTGRDGFTDEPMPNEVTGMHPVMVYTVRLTADQIAREAFGDGFADAVSAIQDEARALRAE